MKSRVVSSGPTSMAARRPAATSTACIATQLVRWRSSWPGPTGLKMRATTHGKPWRAATMRAIASPACLVTPYGSVGAQTASSPSGSAAGAPYTPPDEPMITARGRTPDPASADSSDDGPSMFTRTNRSSGSSRSAAARWMTTSGAKVAIARSSRWCRSDRAAHTRSGHPARAAAPRARAPSPARRCDARDGAARDCFAAIGRAPARGRRGGCAASRRRRDGRGIPARR